MKASSFDHANILSHQNCGRALECMIQCVVFVVGPLPFTSFSRPPCIHMTLLVWWMRPGLPHFSRSSTSMWMQTEEQKTEEAWEWGYSFATFSTYHCILYVVPGVLRSCNITLTYNQSTERLQFINSTWDAMPVSHFHAYVCCIYYWKTLMDVE